MKEGNQRLQLGPEQAASATSLWPEGQEKFTGAWIWQGEARVMPGAWPSRQVSDFCSLQLGGSVGMCVFPLGPGHNSAQPFGGTHPFNRKDFCDCPMNVCFAPLYRRLV